MAIELLFDTETTGLPAHHDPSDAPHQPHIVQLAAVLIDTDLDFKPVSSINLIVKPDGWDVPDEAAQIHGITTEYAETWGLPEREVVAMLLEMWQKGEQRWAFNEPFDARIVRIALKRYGWPEEWLEAWRHARRNCVMRRAADRLTNGGKTIKLTKAYEMVFEREMPEAHTAMGDVKASLALRKWLASVGADGNPRDGEG